MHNKSPFVGAYKLIILGHNHLCLTQISNNKLNYHMEDYEEIARVSKSFKEEDIKERAKENLRLLGGSINDE